MSKIAKIVSSGSVGKSSTEDDDFFSCGSQSQSQSQLSQSNPQTKALNNYLVLDCIFDHLAHSDLVRCSVVNSNWSSISTRKIRKYTVYLHDFVQLRLNGGSYVDSHQKEILVEEKIGKNEKVTVHMTLPTLISKLNDGKNGKSIWLKLSNSDITHRFFQEFLRKLGPFITRFGFGRTGILEISSSVYSVAIWNIISTQLPHLEFLHFEKTPLPNRVNGRWSPVMINQTLLSNLKVLKFSPKYLFPYSVNLQLLKAADNLQKLYNVPLSSIHAYKMKKRVNMIKSVVYDKSPLLISSGNISRLQKLANNHPTLEELTINSIFPTRQDPNILLANSISVFNQLLFSSKDSLEKLSIQTSEYFARLDFPQLQNLKFLQFTDNQETTRNNSAIESASKFKQNFNVNNIFPNVTHVEVVIFINEADLHFQPRVLDLYFPLETFHSSACFRNVQHLKLTKIMAVEAVTRMSVLFPNIKYVDITTDGSILHRILPIIWKQWPNLEVITLKVLFCSRSMNRVQLLDSVITGLSETDIFTLQKNPQKIILPRSYSILNMSNLKKMNIVLLHCTCLPFNPIVSLFSSITGIFGFQKVPGLEVVMALHERTGRRDEMGDQILGTLKELDNTLQETLELKGNSYELVSHGSKIMPCYDDDVAEEIQREEHIGINGECYDLNRLVVCLTKIQETQNNVLMALRADIDELTITNLILKQQNQALVIEHQELLSKVKLVMTEFGRMKYKVEGSHPSQLNEELSPKRMEERQHNTYLQRYSEELYNRIPNSTQIPKFTSYTNEFNRRDKSKARNTTNRSKLGRFFKVFQRRQSSYTLPHFSHDFPFCDDKIDQKKPYFDNN